MRPTCTGSVRLLARLAIISAIAVAVGACLPPPRAEGPTATPPSVPSRSGVPGSSGGPSAAPTPKAQDAAIAAFVKLVASGKFTYRVAFTGDLRASVSDAPVAGSMDVSGEDFASSITYGPGGPGVPKVVVMVRGVAGKGWIKRGTSAWEAIKRFGPAQSYVPFKSVETAADVRFLGKAKVGGKTLYRVSVDDALLVHPNTIPYLVRDARIEESAIEFLIDDAGRPASGRWSLQAKARVGGSGQLQRIAYDLRVTFSKVGGKISVKRP